VVYSHRAVRELPIELARADTLPGSRMGGGGSDGRLDPVDGARVDAWKRTRTGLRHLMWADAGIARSDERLGLASDALADTARDIELEFAAGELDPTLIELRNLAEVARLIVRSARQRRESRGLHYNTDHPHRDNERHLRDTVLSRDRS
jgi:L-aspartate oxidase